MLQVHCISALILDAHGDISESIAISFPSIDSAKKSKPLIIPQVERVANSASHTPDISGYVGPAKPVEGLE